MILSSPGFLLAGVLATAVPLAIFLLWRHRRRPVRWAAMRFLLEAEQARRRRRRLERLLLMAIRWRKEGISPLEYWPWKMHLGYSAVLVGVYITAM